MTYYLICWRHKARTTSEQAKTIEDAKEAAFVLHDSGQVYVSQIEDEAGNIVVDSDALLRYYEEQE